MRFSALQRAENSSWLPFLGRSPPGAFQCSSASRKFLTSRLRVRRRAFRGVSVLFSEPKIPQHSQSHYKEVNNEEFQCSSASRKFLTDRRVGYSHHRREFQCSSASRKFLTVSRRRRRECRGSFSALQRAENSSQPTKRARLVNTQVVSVLFSEPKIPQRRRPNTRSSTTSSSFSALQRAENSSAAVGETYVDPDAVVSVLFSEPKIPHVFIPIFERVPLV